MGAAKEQMGRSRLRKINKQAEIALIGKGLSGKKRSVFLKLLKTNPEAAKHMGRSTRRMRANFAAAYPGETRETKYRNQDWRRAGFKVVADINAALGIKNS